MKCKEVHLTEGKKGETKRITSNSSACNAVTLIHEVRVCIASFAIDGLSPSCSSFQIQIMLLEFNEFFSAEVSASPYIEDFLP